MVAVLPLAPERGQAWPAHKKRLIWAMNPCRYYAVPRPAGDTATQRPRVGSVRASAHTCTEAAPPSSRHWLASRAVLPVVTTSSTRARCRPVTGWRRAKAPCRLRPPCPGPLALLMACAALTRQGRQQRQIEVVGSGARQPVGRVEAAPPLAQPVRGHRHQGIHRAGIGQRGQPGRQQRPFDRQLPGGAYSG